MATQWQDATDTTPIQGDSLTDLETRIKNAVPGFSQKSWTNASSATPITASALNSYAPRVAREVANPMDPKFAGGAVGDNSTDDGAALVACANAVKVAGGEMYIPQPPGGAFLTSQTIDLSTGRTAGAAFRVTGAGSGSEIGTNPTIIYTGASGNLFKFDGTTGWELDHIRVSRSNAAYADHLISIVSAVTAQTGWHIHHVTSRIPATGTRITNGAASIIHMSKAQCSTISNCAFSGAVNAINIGSGFCNVVTIKDNFFIDNQCDILLASADIESLDIDHNTFEAGGLTGAAIQSSSSGLYNGLIRNNWFGDGSPTNWIGSNANSIASQSNSQCVISHNNFMTSATDSCVALKGSWLSIGNNYGGDTAVDSSTPLSFKFVSIGDTGGATQFFNASTFGTTAPANCMMLPGPALTTPFLSPQQLNFKGTKAIDTTQEGSLMLGTVGSTFATPPTTNKALIYFGTVPSTTRRMLVLQAPWGGANGDMYLTAGASAADVIHIQDQKLGFFQATPASKPTVTGSRGGNAALASLLTGLANLGLITDSTTA